MDSKSMCFRIPKHIRPLLDRRRELSGDGFYRKLSEESEKELMELEELMKEMRNLKKRVVLPKDSKNNINLLEVALPKKLKEEYEEAMMDYFSSKGDSEDKRNHKQKKLEEIETEVDRVLEAWIEMKKRERMEELKEIRYKIANVLRSQRNDGNMPVSKN